MSSLAARAGGVKVGVDDDADSSSGQTQMSEAVIERQAHIRDVRVNELSERVARRIAGDAIAHPAAGVHKLLGAERHGLGVFPACDLVGFDGRRMDVQVLAILVHFDQTFRFGFFSRFSLLDRYFALALCGGLQAFINVVASGFFHSYFALASFAAGFRLSIRSLSSVFLAIVCLLDCDWLNSLPVVSRKRVSVR